MFWLTSASLPLSLTPMILLWQKVCRHGSDHHGQPHQLVCNYQSLDSISRHFAAQDTSKCQTEHDLWLHRIAEDPQWQAIEMVIKCELRTCHVTRCRALQTLSLVLIDSKQCKSSTVAESASQDVTHTVFKYGDNDVFTIHPAEAHTIEPRCLIYPHNLTSILLGTMLCCSTYCLCSFIDSTNMQHHAGTIKQAAAQSTWLVWLTTEL